LVPNAIDVSVAFEEIETALVAPFTLSHNKKQYIMSGLLDTGATLSVDGLIDLDLAQRLSQIFDLPLKPLDRKRDFDGFNGQTQKGACYIFFPRLKFFDHEQPSTTLICTQLGRHKLIMGKRWIRQHGIVLDIPERKVLHRHRYCNHVHALEKDYEWDLPKEFDPACPESGWPEPKLEFEEPQVQLETPSEPKWKPQKPIRILSRTHEEDTQNILRTMDQESTQVTTTTIESTVVSCKDIQNPHPPLKEDIAVVSAVAFDKFAKRPGNEVFAISIKDLTEHQEMQRDATEMDPKKLLPTEYHEWLDVSEKEASDTLPEHRSCDHYIDLEGNDPKQLGYSSLRNHSAEELEAIKSFITENLNKDFIRASTAPFAAPVLIVKKPHGGLRMCVDYRRLNAITRKDRYPLPLIEETLARFRGAKIFTKLDIRQAFHRIRMHPESEELTTFRTRYGTYCYRVMPFGLTNGPATFQRYINNALMPYLDEFCSAYMDDILIYSQNLEEHKKHVKMVLQKLREANLQIDLKKCNFHVTETKFLGLILTTDGIRMDPEKVRAIIEWEQPRSIHDVHSFLGFCNFYRRFIQNYANIAKPLNELLRKGAIFHWSEQCEQAFQALKDRVSMEPLLLHFDRDKPAILETDSSDKAYGGILSQYDENNVLRPVAFLSKNLVPAECNYEIYDKELLAIVRCLEQWRTELEGTEIPIQIFTDHKALEYFAEKRKLTRRHARWAEILSQYNFKIIYHSGKQNAKADALSRRPNDPGPGDSLELSRLTLWAHSKYGTAAASGQTR